MVRGKMYRISWKPDNCMAGFGEVEQHEERATYMFAEGDMLYFQRGQVRIGPMPEEWLTRCELVDPEVESYEMEGFRTPG